MGVKRIFNDFHQNPSGIQPLCSRHFWTCITVEKDKVSLSLANLLYGDFITRPRGLVSPMGRDSGQNPSQGPGAPGLLPGDYRVFEVLQGVTPAGHRGVSPRIHEQVEGEGGWGRRN